MEAEILSEGYENDPRKNIHSIYVKEMIINPFAFVQPINYTIEAFVAPADFDPDAQELNIVNAFAAYSDTAEAIFAINASTVTTSLTYNNKYILFETIGGTEYTYDLVLGTSNFTWTVGSTKRYGILQTSDIIYSGTPNGAFWSYFGKRAKYIAMSSSGFQNNGAKYCHYSSSINFNLIKYCAFQACRNLQGELNIPASVATIGDLAFIVCSGITSIKIKSTTPPTISSDTFYGIYSTPLHVPNGCESNYRSAPYWSRFTNIIADL